jgi:hypothetical protein
MPWEHVYNNSDGHESTDRQNTGTNYNTGELTNADYSYVFNPSVHNPRNVTLYIRGRDGYNRNAVIYYGVDAYDEIAYGEIRQERLASKKDSVKRKPGR